MYLYLYISICIIYLYYLSISISSIYIYIYLSTYLYNLYLYLYKYISLSKTIFRFMSICSNMKQIHTCVFLNQISAKTVFRSNGLWVYYSSLKSNFLVNMDTLAVHLCQKYWSKFTHCVLQHSRTLWIRSGSKIMISNLLGLIRLGLWENYWSFQFTQ